MPWTIRACILGQNKRQTFKCMMVNDAGDGSASCCSHLQYLLYSYLLLLLSVLQTLLELQQYSQNLHRRTQQEPGGSTRADGGLSTSGMPGMLSGVALEQKLARSNERLAQLLQYRAMQSSK